MKIHHAAKVRAPPRAAQELQVRIPDRGFETPLLARPPAIRGQLGW